MVLQHSQFAAALDCGRGDLACGDHAMAQATRLR
jgi:hypothetical protein